MVTFLAPNLKADLAASIAVFPPPTTTTSFSPNFGISTICSWRKNSTPPTIPSVLSSPSSPIPFAFCAPMARNTASNCSLSPCSVKSSPSLTFVLTSTPRFIIQLISLSSIPFGRRYSGIPYLNIPPRWGDLSRRVTAYPFMVRKYAQVRPAGPPPTTTTFLPFFGGNSGVHGSSISISEAYLFR
ncbi:MAG: hypothetical protein BWX58_01146 [Deltaproteobacteria bacterium ADurb.Bin026]|nr:MAG: hypothetical protein BWX58_01146 [Deltaproteobacteria bacterium ADurb.Bin026]